MFAFLIIFLKALSHFSTQLHSLNCITIPKPLSYPALPTMSSSASSNESTPTNAAPPTLSSLTSATPGLTPANPPAPRLTAAGAGTGAAAPVARTRAARTVYPPIDAPTLNALTKGVAGPTVTDEYIVAQHALLNPLVKFLYEVQKLNATEEGLAHAKAVLTRVIAHPTMTVRTFHGGLDSSARNATRRLRTTTLAAAAELAETNRKAAQEVEDFDKKMAEYREKLLEAARAAKRQRTA